MCRFTMRSQKTSTTSLPARERRTSNPANAIAWVGKRLGMRRYSEPDDDDDELWGTSYKQPPQVGAASDANIRQALGLYQFPGIDDKEGCSGAILHIHLPQGKPFPPSAYQTVSHMLKTNLCDLQNLPTNADPPMPT